MKNFNELVNPVYWHLFETKLSFSSYVISSIKSQQA